MAPTYFTAGQPAAETTSTLPQEEPRYLLPLHPYLAGIFPVLALFAATAPRVELSDVVWPITLALGGALVVNVLLAMIIPNRDRAALAATWTILLFWSHGPATQLAGMTRFLSLPAIPQSLVLPILLLPWIAGICYLRRQDTEAAQREETDRLAQFANVSGLAGVIAMIALILWNRPDLQPSFEPAAAYASCMKFDDRLAIDANLPVGGGKIRPDIYYIVLHRYAGESTLRDHFNFDNRSFLQSLRKAGFVVPKESWAMEPDARRSLAAALDMRHPSGSATGELEVRRQLTSNHVVRLLKAQGYRYYHLGSPQNGLREHPSADWVYRFSPCSNEFSDSLLRLTPAAPWLLTLSFHDREIGKFDRLAVIPREASPAPKLVVAHLAVPGDNWCLDQDGRELSLSEVVERGEKQNYVNQLRFANNRLRQVIEAIRIQSKSRPAVIVLQSDTAPWTAAATHPGETIIERQPIFTALWLPDAATRARVPAQLSPGNTFRFLFREYFGGEMQLLAEPPGAGRKETGRGGERETGRA